MSIIFYKHKHYERDIRYTRDMKKGNQDGGVVYHAGFPNAAEDQQAGGLSLDALVVQHRASTFFWKLDEPIDELGWVSGTIIVVDRALSPHEGARVVVVVDAVFVVRIFHMQGVLPSLLKPDRTEETSDECVLWGVITYVLQGMKH